MARTRRRRNTSKTLRARDTNRLAGMVSASGEFAVESHPTSRSRQLLAPCPSHAHIRWLSCRPRANSQSNSPACSGPCQLDLRCSQSFWMSGNTLHSTFDSPLVKARECCSSWFSDQVSDCMQYCMAKGLRVQLLHIALQKLRGRAQVHAQGIADKGKKIFTKLAHRHAPNLCQELFPNYKTTCERLSRNTEPRANTTFSFNGRAPGDKVRTSGLC